MLLRLFFSVLLAIGPAVAYAQPQSGGLPGPGPQPYAPASTLVLASGTWLKPAGVFWVKVYAYPGGSGAFNGYTCPNTSSACPGSSGPGGGSVGIYDGPASSLPASVAMTVGAAGVSGVSPTQGGTTSFGIYAMGVAGNSGTQGALNTATSQTGGAGYCPGGSCGDYGSGSGNVALTEWSGSAAGGCTTSACSSAISALSGGDGAGAGGAIFSNVVNNAGTQPRGNRSSIYANGGPLNLPTAACANGSNGPASSGTPMGTSAWGGGSCLTGPGGNGGNGGFPGGNAGPGGTALSPNAGGLGGTPAAGAILIVTS